MKKMTRKEIISGIRKETQKVLREGGARLMVFYIAFALVLGVLSTPYMAGIGLAILLALFLGTVGVPAEKLNKKKDKEETDGED